MNKSLSNHVYSHKESSCVIKIMLSWGLSLSQCLQLLIRYFLMQKLCKLIDSVWKFSIFDKFCQISFDLRYGDGKVLGNFLHWNHLVSLDMLSQSFESDHSEYLLALQLVLSKDKIILERGLNLLETLLKVNVISIEELLDDVGSFNCVLS